MSHQGISTEKLLFWVTAPPLWITLLLSTPIHLFLGTLFCTLWVYSGSWRDAELYCAPSNDISLPLHGEDQQCREMLSAVKSQSKIQSRCLTCLPCTINRSAGLSRLPVGLSPLYSARQEGTHSTFPGDPCDPPSTPAEAVPGSAMMPFLSFETLFECSGQRLGNCTSTWKCIWCSELSQ